MSEWAAYSEAMFLDATLRRAQHTQRARTTSKAFHAVQRSLNQSRPKMTSAAANLSTFFLSAKNAVYVVRKLRSIEAGRPTAEPGRLASGLQHAVRFEDISFIALAVGHRALSAQRSCG